MAVKELAKLEWSPYVKQGTGVDGKPSNKLADGAQSSSLSNGNGQSNGALAARKTDKKKEEIIAEVVMKGSKTIDPSELSSETDENVIASLFKNQKEGGVSPDKNGNGKVESSKRQFVTEGENG